MHHETPSTKSLDRQLRDAGAIALGSKAIHRQTVHELRGILNAMSLNLALLGRAARGELDHLDDARERQAGWVQALEEDLGRWNRLLDSWAELLVEQSGEAETFDLRGTLGDLDRLLSPLAKQCGVGLDLQLSEGAVSIRAPRHPTGRLLIAMVADSLGGLSRGDRLRLELRTEADGTELEVEFERQSTEDGPAETSDAPALATIFGDLLDSLGGSLDAKRSGWSIQWPAVGPTEEGSADHA